MPTKLESLKDEQKRLGKKKNKTSADDKRLQQLSQLSTLPLRIQKKLYCLSRSQVLIQCRLTQIQRICF